MVVYTNTISVYEMKVREGLLWSEASLPNFYIVKVLIMKAWEGSPWSKASLPTWKIKDAK